MASSLRIRLSSLAAGSLSCNAFFIFYYIFIIAIIGTKNLVVLTWFPFVYPLWLGIWWRDKMAKAHFELWFNLCLDRVITMQVICYPLRWLSLFRRVCRSSTYGCRLIYWISWCTWENAHVAMRHVGVTSVGVLGTAEPFSILRNNGITHFNDITPLFILKRFGIFI